MFNIIQKNKQKDKSEGSSLQTCQKTDLNDQNAIAKIRRRKYTLFRRARSVKIMQRPKLGEKKNSPTEGLALCTLWGHSLVDIKFNSLVLLIAVSPKLHEGSIAPVVKVAL